ncbi:MAG TPA: L,D-transpeptidase family protein [Ferruginibacter sp.]|nr:L,D-transpeptidase family protein [Ferruginibacter sp.]
MIKSLMATGIFLILLVSCNNKKKGDNEPAEKDKKVSKRDLSINSSNAYNNLFFDSMVLVQFMADNKVDDALTRRMISFYNTRNYQFAWFTNNGLTEQALGFWNMHNYQTTYGNDSALKDKSLQSKMDGYSEEVDGFPVSSSDKNIINTELKLTQHFIMYALNNIEDGYIKRKEMERFIPRKKEDALLLADSLLTKKHKDDKYYEEVNNAYKLLKDQLGKYVAIAKRGGWPQVTAPAKELKKGISSPAVIQLKKRLQITGDMAADTTPVFNDAVEAGIKNNQYRFGYSQTGIITDALVKDMNVPVLERIKQILLNMGRMQWMINEPKGQMIVVNIPEFILHVKDGPKKVFDMNVVVGKEGHNTMMFTGNLNQVVFSPYWNIPPSIVRKEIMPAMERNPNYLASQNMEITGNEGGLPDIRQLPGAKNSLGRVKFLFPNSFNIYFHDTPAKSLFEKDKRAYSHGCIRLSNPVKMANYLLKDDPQWPADKIDDAMNSGSEKYVKLKNAVPVLITYYTAWVDDIGALHFAEDIYGHDKAVIEKMFTKS